MKYLLPSLLAVFLAGSTIVAADPASELAAFSVFDKIDISDLAKGDVKAVHGPPMAGRFLSVQSCYVAPGSPAQQIEALKNWDPTKHRELKVYIHGDLPASPSPANFTKLKNAPDNGAVRTLVTATQKVSSDLQISKEEAKKFSGDEAGGGPMPASVAAFWSDVLTARVKSFVSGGTSAQPPYDHTGEAIRANDELNSLLKQQEKIRKQFSGFLSQTGIGRGAGSLTTELYWELLDVDDNGVLTLGASYDRAGGSETHQAADVLYYASGGYYVALTLYQMWPVTTEGKPSTLVWRGDMISSASLAELHGVERLGSESAMMKDISKAINLFRKDTDR
ncbi:MAG: hypothetical protein M3R29_01300 [Verrucomicrobiota bacterium]|nr:hypothetical protein [Verrucomicrobiota bacterium]